MNLTTQHEMGSKTDPVDVAGGDGDEDDDDDDEELDEDQLEEYKDMIKQLGDFPDKVKINSLSMVAEDHADNPKAAASIYRCIQQPLLLGPRESKLPLVYVIDSILKNVKGNFTRIIQKDARNWMPLVYTQIKEDQKAKLKKTWISWKEFHIFDDASWREIGACFLTNDGVAQLAAINSSNGAILRSADGELKLNPRVRKQMQLLLDDAQATVENELDKVSLERLADINPELLLTIQKQAEDVLAGGNGQNSQSQSTNKQQHLLLQPFQETRSDFCIKRSAEWSQLSIDHTENAKEVILKLQTSVDQRMLSEEMYTADEALVMTMTLSAAAAVAILVQSFLDALETQKSMQSKKKKAKLFTMVSSNKFTNEGIKERNEGVVAMLYEMGLPFVSSSDGQRFATQLELSKHLDGLFKKNQLNKTMERTEERGWFISQDSWMGLSGGSGPSDDDIMNIGTEKSSLDDNPNKWTVPADENQDKCSICGIHFKMEFDNDDGIYNYSNAREIAVLNDDAAARESETMLVHATCWRGLGSPDVLTMDQTLQDSH